MKSQIQGQILSKREGVMETKEAQRAQGPTMHRKCLEAEQREQG